MSESNQVSTYFTHAAVTFDTLYSEKKMSPLMRFINRRFRSDIYERYALCLEHAQKYNTKTLLDVGCGSGRHALGLSEVGVEQILGIDFSPTMIKLATEYNKNTKGNNRFICYDFMKFETKETYDVVLSMGVFDYIKDPVHVLKKMKKLANHSVVVSFPSISIYRTPLRKFRYYLKQCPLYFYTPAMIQSFAVEAEFADYNITKIKGAGMDYFVTFFK